MLKKQRKTKHYIPFNLPSITNKELSNIREAHKRGQLSGDGHFTKKSQEWIEKFTNTKKAFLTHSCTAALEMMVMLAGIQSGDEVIMPSFTFASTANAVVLRGGVPVFVDIRPDTLNIDEKLIESAISKKTKAIFVVHYAGVSCEMDTIKKIGKKHNLIILEDAAQGFMSKYKGKFLGTIGDLAGFSFHETKNIISGEGGALLINNPKFIDRAEIIREKGTNRSKFFRGEVDKYTWVDMGSSYLPGELIAAFLYAQLERSKKINKKRIKIWKKRFSQTPYYSKKCRA
jgi:dTDP-4-amino-4,6-dideoxygalactose transaminase